MVTHANTNPVWPTHYVCACICLIEQFGLPHVLHVELPIKGVLKSGILYINYVMLMSPSKAEKQLCDSDQLAFLAYFFWVLS